MRKIVWKIWLRISSSWNYFLFRIYSINCHKCFRVNFRYIDCTCHILQVMLFYCLFSVGHVNRTQINCSQCANTTGSRMTSAMESCRECSIWGLGYVRLDLFGQQSISRFLVRREGLMMSFLVRSSERSIVLETHYVFWQPRLWVVEGIIVIFKENIHLNICRNKFLKLIQKLIFNLNNEAIIPYIYI